MVRPPAPRPATASSTTSSHEFGRRGRLVSVLAKAYEPRSRRPELFDMKRCPKCGVTKPRDSFWKKSSKGGLYFCCKSCAGQKAKEWRNKPGNKEAIALRTKAWMVANRTKIQGNQRRYNTGVSKELFSVIVALNNGKCGICAKPLDFSPSHKRVHADHCHSTGAPRGVLCARCNVGLGLLGDNVESIRRALEYLTNPPARLAELWL